MSEFNAIKQNIIKYLNTCKSHTELKDKLSELNKSFDNKSKISVLGKYLIQGVNQDESQSPYNGQLEIKEDLNGKLKATWLIGSDQLQFGTGFKHEHTLVFNFYYKGEGDFKNKKFKGTVIYNILPNGDLNGVWSEKYGDQRFLGKENAKNIKNISTCFSMN